MQLAVAIATHNRALMTWQAIQTPLDDPRVSEIVISDDASDDLNELTNYMRPYSKVRIVAHANRAGALGNKYRAVAACKEDWVVVLDSDNTLNADYIPAMVEAINNQPSMRYIKCPGRANPRWDFTNLSTYDRSVRHDLNNGLVQIYLNIGNYVVPRAAWLSVIDPTADVYASDVLWANYLWLQGGGRLEVVPGASYTHNVHAGSIWMQTATPSMAMADKIYRMMELWHD